MFFRFLFAFGFTVLILMTTADISKNNPDGKNFFYYPPLANETSSTSMEYKDSQPKNYSDENSNSSTLFADDQNQCQIKQTIQCDPAYPYRTLNGSCNNLAHPTWGIAKGCYLRLQPAFYDGYDNFPKSVTGNSLPEPRDLTLNIFKEVHRPSSKVSFMFTVYGQTIAHDLSRAAISELDSNCCSPEAVNNPSCAAISVKPDDPFYSHYNFTCLFMHRTKKCTDCSDTSRQQINAATAAMDASILYGSDDTKAMQIRSNDGSGKLVSNLTTNGEILPFDNNAHRLFCPLQENCFFTGDKRVNQHTFLSSLETLFMREHNRVATKLKELNPNWEEEKLYQETRRIVIATLQCITYKEYLPILLGPSIMRKFDLAVKNTSNGTKYDPNIQTGVRNEFANAAFRLHSMIPNRIGSFELSFKEVYQNPELIIDGHLEKLTRGACKAPSEKFDHHYATDVTNYLGLHRKIQFGTDLASIDIQRNRDHGLAPYVVMVTYCSEGQVNITSFDDLSPLLMPKKRVKTLKENYQAVEDVDLYVGMQLEHKFPGSEVGPTAACIISRQFYFSKFGDRFYFEHEGEVPSFTKAQKKSIKQCSLSRLFCDNSNMTHVQKSPMTLPGPENPEVLCDDIPKIELTDWREIP